MNRLFSIRHAALQTVVLLAVALLGTANAGATRAAESTANATVPSHVDSSRLHAKQANQEAVTEAAKMIIQATKTDLDLRLIGPTSVLVASR